MSYSSSVHVNFPWPFSKCISALIRPKFFSSLYKDILFVYHSMPPLLPNFRCPTFLFLNSWNLSIIYNVHPIPQPLYNVIAEQKTFCIRVSPSRTYHWHRGVVISKFCYSDVFENKFLLLSKGMVASLGKSMRLWIFPPFNLSVFAELSNYYCGTCRCSRIMIVFTIRT